MEDVKQHAKLCNRVVTPVGKVAMWANRVLLAHNLARGGVIIPNAERLAKILVISVSNYAPGNAPIKENARWNAGYYATVHLVTDAVRRRSIVATNALQCVEKGVQSKNIVSSARMPTQWI